MECPRAKPAPTRGELRVPEEYHQQVCLWNSTNLLGQPPRVEIQARKLNTALVIAVLLLAPGCVTPPPTLTEVAGSLPKEFKETVFRF